MKSSIPEYAIALLGCAIMSVAVMSLADTVYFDNGESVEVPAGELYRSAEPLYGVTGDLSKGVTVTPAEPLIAPSEPVTEPTDPFEGLCDGPRPTGELTFELVNQQKYWDQYCAPDEPEEYVPNCDEPRPGFDGTFDSIWNGKAWDAACDS